jgi:hypothetical protein
MNRNEILMMLSLLLLVNGCNAPSSDERLAQFAQASVEQQSKQNETIARQSQAVIVESSQLADAAGDMVAKDAESRKQLIAAQQQLTSELHAERSRIDQQKQAFDLERRELAESRHREPILAATIQSVGIALVALLPLAVCIYVLRQLYWNDSSDETSVAELLLSEFTSERPLLLLRAPHHPPMLNGTCTPSDNLGSADLSDDQ